MRVRYEDLRSLVQSGGVFTAADLLEKLSTMLTDSQKQELVTELALAQEGAIRPGDLVRSANFNKLTIDVMDLKLKVAKLEAGAGVPSGQVVIYKPLPGDQFRATYDMSIEGKNFGFSQGASIVKIGTILVTDYRAGSTDEKLVVGIPQIAVPAGGQDFLLTVSNGVTSAQRQIYLLPAEDLSGHVNLSWIEAMPTTPSTGGELTLKIKAYSLANLDGKFMITPVVSRVSNADEWIQQLEVLDKNHLAIPDRQVMIGAKKVEEFYVRIKKIPVVTGNATPVFAITVNISSGAVKDKAGPLLMKVGDVIRLPDPDISFAYFSHEFKPTMSDGKFERGDEEDTVTIAPSTAAVTRVGVFTMAADITKAGKYILSADKVSGAVNWTVQPHASDSNEVNVSEADLASSQNKSVRRLCRYQIAPGLTPDDFGEVRLKINRDDGSGLNASVLMLVKKG